MQILPLAAMQTQLLLPVDYVVILVYLAGIVTLGCWFARGQKNTDDYFVASRRMHWFPLALSIWASLTSANSMLGAPSYAYSQDLQQVPFAAFLGIGAAFVVIRLILPLLHRLRLTTAYEYLEKRYSLPVRCLGSVLFVLLRGGWLATVIYVPSFALSAVIPIHALDVLLDPLAQVCGTNGNALFWVLVVGVGATIYTTMGGLKAVIWTDVAQFFVFVFGIVAVWFLLISELPNGLQTLLSELGNVPRAYAGENQTVAWNDEVTLDGTKSREFEGRPLHYEWRQIDAERSGYSATLEAADSAQPRFRAPASSGTDPIDLTFMLRVTTTGNPPLQSPPSVVTVTMADERLPTPPSDPPTYHERRRDTWFDFHWRLFFSTGVTFWLLLFSQIAGRLNDAGTDQVALQRYFSAETFKESRRAIWVNALCDMPLMPLLFMTGAGVLVYYAVFHNPDVPVSPGQAMPFFVAHKLNDLVPGLSGLFIAALFAATMSSVDSGINSISAAFTTDWYKRLIAPGRTEKHYLKTSRIATFVLGLLGTLAALFLGRIGEVWQIAAALMGFWVGPLLGIFMLGFFTTRSNSKGVWIGAVTGLVCTVVFQQLGGNEFCFAIVGLAPTMLVGYVASRLTKPPRPEQIDGLTHWTRKPLDE